jgi:hypothetical protein
METGRVEIGGMVVDVVECFWNANTVERGGYGGVSRSSNVWLTNTIDPASHLVDFWSESSPAPHDEDLPRVDTEMGLDLAQILGSNSSQASSPLTPTMESCDTRALITASASTRTCYFQFTNCGSTPLDLQLVHWK